jgi:hypothetical protein
MRRWGREEERAWRAVPQKSDGRGETCPRCGQREGTETPAAGHHGGSAPGGRREKLRDQIGHLFVVPVRDE